jgi:2-polyprenyl-6-methoxyphenol hydroxylase-like FAD-dependent oxidoreductase
VAGALGLPKDRPLAGDIGMTFAYWRGVPTADHFTQEAREKLGMNLIPCEDDVTLLLVFGPADLTRGDAATRRRRYLEGLALFPETAEAVAHRGAEMVTDLVIAPETMLRGFFRPAAGPGWALIGDANHFKHPATAQGISDAVEQAIYVAAGLGGSDEDLAGYEAWRDARADGHYEWSFTFGRLPLPETAGPVFEGFAADQQAQQDLRDVMSRAVHPSEAMSEERMQRWFAAANAA